MNRQSQYKRPYISKKHYLFVLNSLSCSYIWFGAHNELLRLQTQRLGRWLEYLGLARDFHLQFKGRLRGKMKNYKCFPSPVALSIYLHCFAVTCSDIADILEISSTAGTGLVVLAAPETIHLKNSTATPLPINHDPVTEDNPQTLLRASTRQRRI